jgi:hypothetical protein
LFSRALKQDFVKKGRRTLKGFAKDAINAAKRYYLNIFEDTLRERGANLITGDERSNSRSTNPSLAMLSRQFKGGGGGASANEMRLPTFNVASNSGVVDFDNDHDSNGINEKAYASRGSEGIPSSCEDEGYCSIDSCQSSTTMITDVENLLTSRNSNIDTALDRILQRDQALLYSLSKHHTQRQHRKVRIDYRTGVTESSAISVGYDIPMLTSLLSRVMNKISTSLAVLLS